MVVHQRCKKEDSATGGCAPQVQPKCRAYVQYTYGVKKLQRGGPQVYKQGVIHQRCKKDKWSGVVQQSCMERGCTSMLYQFFENKKLFFLFILIENH